MKTGLLAIVGVVLIVVACLLDELRPKPKKFEYQFHHIGINERYYELDVQTMGRYGWELIQLQQEGEYRLLVFKKETR